MENKSINSDIQNSIQKHKPQVIIIGGGLAGCECAWQLAQANIRSLVIEQRPHRTTDAHKTENLAELVCSNSLKSTDPTSAPGLLKHELSLLNSLILQAAYKAQVPAGQALGVDRDQFAQYITAQIEQHPLIEVLRCEVEHFEQVLCSNPEGEKIPVVIATGPLSGASLLQSLQPLIGNQLYFYDAIAPIIAGESINREIVFRQNRYNKLDPNGNPEGDYLNCPLNKEEYFAFIKALEEAPKVDFKTFEKAVYFQGCQPIEALLERGPMTLAFGPMKPKGLLDPRTGREPFAAVQLRAEDIEERSYNMVGFQTKLKYEEQKRVFRLIPGLENSEFYRMGSLHRNTYVQSPTLLGADFQLKASAGIYFAGQITGVEGYLESTAIGALVARLLILKKRGLHPTPLPPQTTALGALAHAIVYGRVKDFQPMNINWGLVPLKDIAERDKDKKNKLVIRAKRQFELWSALF